MARKTKSQPSAAASTAVTITADAATAGLDALIADLTAKNAADGGDEIVEETSPALLAAALDNVEAAESSVALATPEGIVVDPDSAPSAEKPAATGEPVAKKRRAKKTDATKPAPTPRKFYSDKTERLKDRVGAGLAEYTVLTVSDAAIDEEQIKLRMDETLKIIRGMSKKKQNRATALIEFVAGKKAKLNEIAARTLQVLQRDGHINTGKDGNVMAALTKPASGTAYTLAAARAMGGNTIAMMEDLKLLVADGKGKFVGNPESTLLATVNNMLFRASAPAA